MDEGEKKGIDLVIDRVEALRVRIENALDVYNDCEHGFDHWAMLCKEALAELHSLNTVYERITALLALPRDATPSDVVKAIEIAVRVLQELEAKVHALRQSHL